MTKLPTRAGQPPTPPTMEVGKIEQLTTETHRPRHMAHTRSVAPQKSQLEAEYLELLAWAQAIYKASGFVVEDAKHSISVHAQYSKLMLEKHLQDAPEAVKGGE